MNELGRHSRELVDSARSELSSAKSDRERLRSLIDASAAVGVRSARASHYAWRWYGVTALALGIVAVFLVRFGTMTTRSTHNEAAHSLAKRSAAQSPPGQPAASHVILPLPVSPGPVVREDRQRSAHARARVVRMPSISSRVQVDNQVETQARSPAATTEPPTAAVLSDTIREEAILLGRVRGALRRNDIREAESGIREHAARFPHGLLVEEREAALVLCLCRSGTHADAAAALLVFVERFPRSALRASVDAECRDR